MYNQKLYNTRNSGRYNNAGQFVPASDNQQQYQTPPRKQPPPPPQQQQQQFQQQQQYQQQQPQLPQQQQTSSNLQQVPIQTEDVEMKQEVSDSPGSKQGDRPAWMKSKLGGVKKVPNKERRRRQNETLRRLLTPKNALMVLNEMLPRDNLTNQFTVEAAQSQFYARNNFNFCADLTLEGNSYKGYGENKLSARNNAAEQAIRDLIIKKMNKVVAASTAPPTASPTAPDNASDAGGDEESLPMIQLASFALHKLFMEWEEEGHKVPQLRTSNASVSEAVAEAPMPEPKPKASKPKTPKPRTLPTNAGSMHPCMLLGFMKPGVEYRELGSDGDKPQNMTFTMGVDVDGATYIGKASNKKESRKQAARAACSALFGVVFDTNPVDTKPVLPAA